MNQAEEDALIREHQLRSGDPVEQRIRLAIREAVAQERERCAKVCDSVNNYDNPMTANDCAAAIRRGE